MSQSSYTFGSRGWCLGTYGAVRVQCVAAARGVEAFGGSLGTGPASARSLLAVVGLIQIDDP